MLVKKKNKTLDQSYIHCRQPCPAETDTEESRDKKLTLESKVAFNGGLAYSTESNKKLLT